MIPTHTLSTGPGSPPKVPSHLNFCKNTNFDWWFLVIRYDMETLYFDENVRKTKWQELESKALQVPPETTLITPIQCKSPWRQFKAETEHAVTQAITAQEEKIQKEIQELRDDIAKQDKYVEHCNGKITDLESQISQFREGFKRHKSERDKLQDERKSLCGKESELSGEIDRLKAEVGKAEKILDHATPGVLLL